MVIERYHVFFHSKASEVGIMHVHLQGQDAMYADPSLACLFTDTAARDVGSIVEQLSQQHTRLI